MIQVCDIASSLSISVLVIQYRLFICKIKMSNAILCSQDAYLNQSFHLDMKQGILDIIIGKDENWNKKDLT